MDIRPIRTPEDHARALEEIEALWDKAEPGTKEAERFDVLSTLVDAYEDENFPIGLPDPIEAIKIRVAEKQLRSRDLLALLTREWVRGSHGVHRNSLKTGAS